MIRFTKHARERRAQRDITAQEVFRISAHPVGRINVKATGNIDFFGPSDDGRPFQITIDPSKGTDGVIVTIIDIEAEARERAAKGKA